MISERKKTSSVRYIHIVHTHTHLFYCYIYIIQKRENAYNNIIYPSLLIRARGAAVYVRLRIATRVSNTSSYRLTGFHCRLWTLADTYLYIYIYYERYPIHLNPLWLTMRTYRWLSKLRWKNDLKLYYYTICDISTCSVEVAKCLCSLKCGAFRKRRLLYSFIIGVNYTVQTLSRKKL